MDKDDSIVKSQSSSTGLMTGSGSIEHSLDVILGGINFTIVVNELGDTTHWSTNDVNFKTPEGYGVGADWDIIPMNLKKSLHKMPGWGYYMKLNSGWQLAFCEGQSCTDAEPKEGSTVQWIFKRKKKT